MDANGGYPATVLVGMTRCDGLPPNSTLQNAMIQAPDTPSLDDVLVISLLPALPAQWPNGHVHGARIRRGLEMDLDWAGGVLTKAVLRAPRMVAGMKVKVVIKGVNNLGPLTVKRGMTIALV